MKAVIYYRKSTDRDDKQANSLEHQLANCKRIASVNGFDVLEEIGESKSAKTEWTRAWFNRLIKLCQTGKIDYIVIDEPKRLSRNNLDSARIIDLFDKKQVKWIFSTGRNYLADQINDVFLLQLDLSLSKMDNAHRSKDVKDKMTTCINNTKRFLAKAPFGYKNITVKKWHKEIVVNEKEAKVVKEIFDLRLENKALSTIWKIIESKYGTTINLKYRPNRIFKLVRNKFYYGVFVWDWKEIIWTHKPLITKEIYDKANNVWKWVHEQSKTLQDRILNPRTYHLKGLVKDMTWIKLTCYEKKGHSYYWNQSRSTEKVSINEDLIFHKIWEIIQTYDCSNQIIHDVDKERILNLIREEETINWKEVVTIDKQIHSLKMKQEKLLDMKLDEVIDEKTYLFKHNQLENQIKDFLDQISALKKDDFMAKTQILLELAWSLYRSYSTVGNEWKAFIIKNLMLELFVDNKKELQIAESPLFESSKMLNFSFGTPEKFEVRKYKWLLSRVNFQHLKEFRDFLRHGL